MAQKLKMIFLLTNAMSLLSCKQKKARTTITRVECDILYMIEASEVSQVFKCTKFVDDIWHIYVFSEFGIVHLGNNFRNFDDCVFVARSFTVCVASV